MPINISFVQLDNDARCLYYFHFFARVCDSSNFLFVDWECRSRGRHGAKGRESNKLQNKKKEKVQKIAQRGKATTEVDVDSVRSKPEEQRRKKGKKEVKKGGPIVGR